MKSWGIRIFVCVLVVFQSFGMGTGEAYSGVYAAGQESPVLETIQTEVESWSVYLSSFTDEDVIQNVGYYGLPEKLKADLTTLGYSSDDIPVVVEMKLSKITQMASLVITLANTVNEGSGLAIEYLEGGYSGVMEMLFEELMLHTAEQDPTGFYIVQIYKANQMSGELDNWIDLGRGINRLSDLAGKGQTLSLSLAQTVLEQEMNYINNNMDQAFADIGTFNMGSSDRLLVYAVHIDKFHFSSGMRESGVRFFYYKTGADTYSPYDTAGKFINYYNNIIYSRVKLIPEVSPDEFFEKRAVQAVEAAEMMPAKLNVMAARALVEDLYTSDLKASLLSRLEAVENIPMTYLPLFEMPENMVSSRIEVDFEDSNLESAVREAIGKSAGTIYAEDLEGLTSLSSPSSGIYSLSGLEYAVNLESIDVSRNSISDLQPLAGLNNLFYIAIHNNNISNLAPLSNLTKMKKLVLWSNDIEDLTPLNRLTALEYLDISRNDIEDITPIRDCVNLSTLSIAHNNISSIEPVRNMVKLVHFYIGGNPVLDTSPTDEFYHKIERKDF